MVAASAYAETASSRPGKGGAAATAESRETAFVMDPEEEVVTFK
jgi:hypothetical protein